MFKEENNMKFKKFMALGLVAAMTATLFAGCGSKGNDSAEIRQRFRRWSCKLFRHCIGRNRKRLKRNNYNVQPQNRYGYR